MAKRRASKSKRVRPTRGPKARRSSLPQRVNWTEEAIKILGEEQVRRRIEIGETGWLTPTKSGFAALDDLLLELQRASSANKRALWTYDLVIRFRGPNGEYVTRFFAGVGFPRMRDINANLRSIERRRGKKFTSDAEAYRHVAESGVIAAIHRQIDNTKSLKGGTDELIASLKGKSREQVREAWRKFKASRSLSFKLRVFRIVTKKEK